MAHERNNRAAEHAGEEGQATYLHQLEVTVRAILEEQNQHINQSCAANTQNISQNAKSIAILNELICKLTSLYLMKGDSLRPLDTTPNICIHLMSYTPGLIILHLG